MSEKPETLGEKYIGHLEGFFSAMTNPNHRLFIAYLLSSVLIAYVLYRKSKSDEGLLRFIFPKSVCVIPISG